MTEKSDTTIDCGRCAGTGVLLNGDECPNCEGDGEHDVEVIKMISELNDSIVTYIRKGPDAGGSSATKRVIGLWLWWRLWAGMGVFLLGASLVGFYFPESERAFYGFIVGLFTAVAAGGIMDDD